MKYMKGKIVSIRKSGNLLLIETDLTVETQPGQFYMVRLEQGEKPFSPFNDNPLSFIVKIVGKFTERLAELNVGDVLWVRGPYGKGTFPHVNNVMLIGGGTGIAPLLLFALKNKGRVKGIIYGARSKEELIVKELVEKLNVKTIFCTDDGSFGEKGFVTEVLEKNVEWAKSFDNFFVCGPEKMMVKVCETLEKFSNPNNIFVSLERYVKCGIGLCGSCDFGGYRICVDGPVFDYSLIKSVEDFGRFKRDASGRIVKI